jgi:N-acetylmuramoyl-L-alanine amidase
VTLSIGYKVEKILKKKGFDVFLTRDCDKTVLLDERTSFANNFSEDKILLSIHANSSLNTGASGIETFFLDNSLFQDNDFFYGDACKESIKIIENRRSIRSKNSFLLASNLQENVYNFIKQASSKYKDRGVKKSVSQLLLGSHMPAALIEVGFLSNDKDLKFLQLLDNHEIVASGICKGIVEYFEHKIK